MYTDRLLVYAKKNKPFSRIVTIGGLMLKIQNLGFSYMNIFTLLGGLNTIVPFLLSTDNKSLVV